MKKVVFGILLFFFAAAILLAPSLVSAGYEDPLPNSSCIDGILKIYMNPRHVSTIHAVRIDYLSNPWNGDKPLPGDIVMNKVKGSAFVREMGTGRGFGWWIHDVDQNGVINPVAKGGNVYCFLAKPTGLTSEYSRSTLTLRWDAVQGAVKYAIRVDNTQNPWNPGNMQPGDILKNDLSQTSFSFLTSRGKTYGWWVHAIDQNGVYSEASGGSVTTK